jgi:outer membrane protein OmpA-like peptidoglycan-associated protein
VGSTWNFVLNKSTLTSTANLDKLVPVFQSYAVTDIVIYGFTDSTSRVEYNQTLSEQRAISVRAYLALYGLSGSRIKTKGLGVNVPISSIDTPDGGS